MTISIPFLYQTCHPYVMGHGLDRNVSKKGRYFLWLHISKYFGFRYGLYFSNPFWDSFKQIWPK